MPYLFLNWQVVDSFFSGAIMRVLRRGGWPVRSVIQAKGCWFKVLILLVFRVVLSGFEKSDFRNSGEMSLCNFSMSLSSSRILGVDLNT